MKTVPHIVEDKHLRLFYPEVSQDRRIPPKKRKVQKKKVQKKKRPAKKSGKVIKRSAPSYLCK